MEINFLASCYGIKPLSDKPVYKKQALKACPNDTVSFSGTTQKAYKLSEINEGYRMILPSNVMNSNTIPSLPKNSLSFFKNIEFDNRKIDKFCQGMRGDCYFLASLHSLKTTKDGQKILFDNIKKNPDGSFDVTLPGAVQLNKKLKEEGIAESSITGKYRITKEAIKKAKSLSGKSYAFGDIEVIALELAMEAYRAESQKDREVMKLDYDGYVAGKNASFDIIDTLSGGWMFDATFITTGLKSEVYEATEAKLKHIKPYVYGEYGYVYDDKTKILGKQWNSLLKEKHICGVKIDGIKEVTKIYNKDSDLQKLLDKYKGKEKQYSITVAVKVAESGPDGVTKAGGGHALAVTKITDYFVEVVNPWNTTQRERIPRADFEKMACHLGVTEISYNKYIQNK